MTRAEELAGKYSNELVSELAKYIHDAFLAGYAAAAKELRSVEAKIEFAEDGDVGWPEVSDRYANWLEREVE